MVYMAAAVTDAGIIKKINQDSLTVKIVQTPKGQVCMAVICDGLGGLSLGEVASANAVLTFDYWLKEQFLQTNIEWTQKNIIDSWQKIIADLNGKIMNFGLKHGIETGTTLTAALFFDDKFYVAHIGDTRVYEIKDCCRQLTKDQTVTEKALEQGIITKEQAINDSRKNVLLQCVGVTKNLMPDFYCGNVTDNAAYLLCSDGFRHLISSEEIYKFCNSSKNLSQSAMEKKLLKLVECNKKRGESDNISAILIQAGNAIC